MNQLLPRGCHLLDDTKITRMIASGKDWQIYMTNMDTYALAVELSLYEKWIEKCSLPEGIFLPVEMFASCRVFVSKGDYIISSIDKGPYPANNGQVEAFSIAFNTATKLYDNFDVLNAIYIEEYSLLLPTAFDVKIHDNKTAYGKWLTGGVNISIDSFNRVKKIMSWLPKESLAKSVELAGFTVNEQQEDETVDGDTNIQIDNTVQETLTQKNFNGKFVLIGRPELEQFFNDNIIDIVLHQEQYKRMGISFPGATILHGPPGCGKTYAVEKLSEYLGWKRFDIDSSTIASSYIHDTSKKISEVFKAAIDSAPSILVIDEMEAFLSDRSMSGHSGTHHIEEVAEFLRRIPEAISKGVLVFAMTNMIDSIDPAILRRGRFDHIIEVKMASAEEIEQLLKAKFAELPVEKDVDVQEISKQLSEHPMSDVAFVIREAGRFAVKSNLELMDKKCFAEALNLLPKKKERNPIGFNTQVKDN